MVEKANRRNCAEFYCLVEKMKGTGFLSSSENILTYLTDNQHMMYNANRQSSEMRGVYSRALKMTRGQPGHFFVLITAYCVCPATCR